MKITVLEVVGTTERISKSTNKPYKLTTLKDTEGNLYTDLYIGRSVKQGDELELTRNDRGGWDVAKDQQAGRSYGGGKDNPEQRASIEWQSSYKAAVEVARDFFTFNPDKLPDDLDKYAKAVDKLAVHFKKVIELKPDPVELSESAPKEEPDDQPPLDNYADDFHEALNG